MRTSILPSLTVLVIAAGTASASPPTTAADGTNDPRVLAENPPSLVSLAVVSSQKPSPPESARVMYPGFERLRLGMDIETATSVARKAKGVSNERMFLDSDGKTSHYDFSGADHSEVFLNFDKDTEMLVSVTFSPSADQRRKFTFNSFRSDLENYFGEKLSFEEVGQGNDREYRCFHEDTLIKVFKGSFASYRISKRLYDRLRGGQD
jgi:hypothetical protein